MTSPDPLLRDRLSRFWQSGGSDTQAAEDLVMHALATPPVFFFDLARTVQVTHLLGSGTYVDDRIELELRQELARLLPLVRLIDQLGDSTIDPAQRVFDTLADALPSTRLDDADVDALRKAPVGMPHRTSETRALLDAVGWSNIAPEHSNRLRRVVDSLAYDAQRHQAHALLVSEQGAGVSLAVDMSRSDVPGPVGHDAVDPAMKKQAQVVASLFGPRVPGFRWQLEWPVLYEGSSIGLGLYLAGLVAFENLRPDPLLAATGELHHTGRVEGVGGAAAKLAAAAAMGIQRVLLPEDNRSEAEHWASVWNGPCPDLLFVSDVHQIRQRLADVAGRGDFSFEGRLRLIKAQLAARGLVLTQDKATQNSRQLHVEDAQGRAIIHVYTGAKGTVQVTGASAPTVATAEQLVADLFVGARAQDREAVSWNLPEEWRRDQLREALEKAGAERREASGTGEVWRYELRRYTSTARATVWRTGTCRLTGTAPAFDELQELIAQATAGLANAEPAQRGSAPPTPTRPTGERWIGTDESGKGDYFGPLVSAAVFVDRTTAAQLEALGVRDSKRFKDGRIRQLANEIRAVLGRRFKVTSINPAKYNELSAQMRKEGKNLNTLLAWGHTRSIEDLLAEGVEPEFAVIDQFADKSYIEGKLLKGTRKANLQIVLYPKAESDIAVAAASILARNGFLIWMDRTSEELGVRLPKGASDAVVEAARGIYQRGGEAALRQVAKISFKTTAKVVQR